MMEDLSYLSSLTPAEFEAERNRLIANEILKAPPERRQKMVQFQTELNRVRAASTPAQFMAHCMKKITENLENLEDQFRHLKSVVEPPPVRPPAER